MTKKQKIWFWVFAVLFLLPEVLWGPLVSFINFWFDGNAKTLLSESNILSNYPSLSAIILLSEGIGIIGLMKLNTKLVTHKALKYVFNIILGVILVSLVFVLYVSSSIGNINF